MKKPLDGYLVVDLTTFVAAPAAGRLLADLGARVIKIEPPKGDSWRGTGTIMGRDRFSQSENPIFDLYNNGKDLISLDLKSEDGRTVLNRLLQKADVFITNNRPASLARMGLDYDTLHQLYPRLVYGIVLGYGDKGPEATKKAFDNSAFWARSGFVRDQATVFENGQYEPVPSPASVGDSYTGTVLAMQILAALMQRQQSGQGQKVSATLYHVGLFAMATMIVKQQRPFGPVMPDLRAQISPNAGAFQCADGEWIYFSGDVYTVFELAGRKDLLADTRFFPENRKHNKPALLQTLRECFRQKSLEQWLEALEPFDTPSVKIPHYADVPEDPQAWANDFLRKVDYPTGYTHCIPTPPLEMEHVQIQELAATKNVGADTARVLAELGYSPEEIAEMELSGAVVCK